MKKAEAISILATSVRPREAKDRARYDEAVRMAIEALKRSETPNSSDCISRQAAIDCVTYDVEHTIECLKALSSAQPDCKRPHWIISSDGYYPYCSECKSEPKNGEMTDFCPNCGADMRGTEDG